MAEVFLAEATGGDGFRRLVALKRILPCYSRDEEFILRFKSEALLGGSLNHNNIVPAFDFGREGEHYYIVMAYVDGLPLSRLLRYRRQQEAPLPLPVVLDITRQLCDGLAYAHAAKDPGGHPLHMIHRDLKPANILVSQFGEIKITDFGIAKASTNLQQTTVEPGARGAALGTIAYMSPEQARAETLDHRSDLYSLGAILFELLTLEQLYPNAVGMPGLFLVQQGDVERRFHLLEPFPAELREVVARLLARDREHRYGSASEVKRDLLALSSRLQQGQIELSDLVREALEALSGPRPVSPPSPPPPDTDESHISLLALDQTIESRTQETGARSVATAQAEVPGRTSSQGSGQVLEPSGAGADEMPGRSAARGPAGGEAPATGKMTGSDEAPKAMPAGVGEAAAQQVPSPRRPAVPWSGARAGSRLRWATSAFVVGVLWLAVWAAVRVGSGGSSGPLELRPDISMPASRLALPVEGASRAGPPTAAPAPAIAIPSGQGALPPSTAGSDPVASVSAALPEPPTFSGRFASPATRTPAGGATPPTVAASPAEVTTPVPVPARMPEPPPEPASSRPPAAVSPATASSGPARESTGSLSINSRPFSIVYLDGRKLGETPIRDEEISAGHHRLELKTEDGTTRRVLEVEIRAGELTNLKTVQLAPVSGLEPPSSP